MAYFAHTCLRNIFSIKWCDSYCKVTCNFEESKWRCLCDHGN